MGRHGTIAGRKAAQDKKRGAIFTKVTREIIMAAKSGGDPDYNASLKNAIAKAKAVNLTNDKINNAIKRGTGELEGESYENLTFEGYGASGIAVIVETLTDNKNRTTSAVKHHFDKHGGNLGVPGCVAYMFERKGVILIEKTDGVDEDVLMEAALDAGAEDFLVQEEYFEIQTTPDDFHDVAENLRKGGYELLESDVELIPNMETEPKSNSDLKALIKMIEVLEEDDDVQKVYTNSSVDLHE